MDLLSSGCFPWTHDENLWVGGLVERVTYPFLISNPRQTSKVRSSRMVKGVVVQHARLWVRIPYNSCKYMICKYLDLKGSSAMLVVTRSAGVTPVAATDEINGEFKQSNHHILRKNLPYFYRSCSSWILAERHKQLQIGWNLETTRRESLILLLLKRRLNSGCLILV